MSKLSSEKRNRLNDSDFGIPEKRMYPLHDKAHIESAVRLFGHAENKYKRSRTGPTNVEWNEYR